MLKDTLARNRSILKTTVGGVGRGLIHRRSEFRHHVLRDGWTIVKRFGADSVENIELREIPGIQHLVLEGYIDDRQRLVIAALVRALGCRTFFEFGTNRGRTTWTVARNNPDLRLFTLDVGHDQQAGQTTFALGSDDRTFFRDDSCGEAFRDTDESARIEQLWGDSARFDFSPYKGQMDFVYIDGAHTLEYVRSDSRSGLEMLSEGGTIVWDDYTSNPGVMQCVAELARTARPQIVHVLGTRMAMLTRKPIIDRVGPDDHASLPAL